MEFDGHLVRTQRSVRVGALGACALEGGFYLSASQPRGLDHAARLQLLPAERPHVDVGRAPLYAFAAEHALVRQRLGPQRQHRTDGLEQGLVDRARRHRTGLHAAQHRLLAVAAGRSLRAANIDMMADRQAGVLRGEAGDFFGTGFRTEQRLAMLKQLDVEIIAFGVGNYQQIDGLAAVAAYRFDVDRFERIRP